LVNLFEAKAELFDSQKGRNN